MGNNFKVKGKDVISMQSGLVKGPIVSMTCKPFTTRTTLRNLPDNAAFKFSTGSHVVYRLQSLDHKKRIATYTSEASKRTYKAGWGKEVMV